MNGDRGLAASHYLLRMWRDHCRRIVVPGRPLTTADLLADCLLLTAPT